MHEQPKSHIAEEEGLNALMNPGSTAGFED